MIKDSDGEVEGCHATEDEAKEQMAALYANEGKSVEHTEDRGHILLKAATTVATELGQFAAVISTASVDREKDIVEPEAMVKALHKWNRPVPLAWNHSTDPEDIIGHVDPKSAKAVGLEVMVDGQVDLESKRGSEAWRSFKSRSVGFSFGYLIPDGGATERKGGGLHISELDVFEITATPTPMNNDTRVVSWKSVEGTDQILQELRKVEQRLEDLEKKSAEEADKEPLARSVDPLLERSRQEVQSIRLDGVPERKSPRKPSVPAPEPPDQADLRERTRTEIMAIIRGA